MTPIGFIFVIMFQSFLKLHVSSCHILFFDHYSPRHHSGTLLGRIGIKQTKIVFSSSLWLGSQRSSMCGRSITLDSFWTMPGTTFTPLSFHSTENSIHRFLDRITPTQVRHIYLMLIFSAAATTISMFLHTLKFKKYIGPKTSYLWYMSSYLATFYSWVRSTTLPPHPHLPL